VTMHVRFSVSRVPDAFFFSSRRRHTRSKRDWSSDVCSSDLFLPDEIHLHFITYPESWINIKHIRILPNNICTKRMQCRNLCSLRSEERRVGKEERTR